MTTTVERWDAAIKEARKAGVKVRQNVQQCCRGCITPEKLGLKEDDETTPYAFTFGGQGNAITWYNNQAYYRAELNRTRNSRSWYGRKDPKPVDRVFWNHGGEDLKAAEAIKAAFENNGFTVEWNGEGYECVQIVLGESE